MDAMLGPSQRPWWHAACPAVIRYAAWWAVGAVVLATGSQAFAESLSTSNTSDPIKALSTIREPPLLGPHGQHGRGLTDSRCAHGARHGLVQHFPDVQPA